MAIQQKLHTRLVQKLILTPSLQQAIKLLPMTTLELADLLNQEMVENPMLEEVPTEELPPPEVTPAVEQAEKKAEEKGDTWDDADYEYFFGEYLDDGYRPRQPQEVKELPPIENTLSSKSSLADHLFWQLNLNLQTTDEAIREVGAAIIGNIDEDGYLVASLDEIAGLGGWDIGLVERALEYVQVVRSNWRRRARFAGVPAAPDPAPWARRDARRDPRARSSAPAPEPPDPRAGAALMSIEPEEVKEHIELIKQLDPKPGVALQPGGFAVRHPGRLHRRRRTRATRRC